MIDWLTLRHRVSDLPASVKDYLSRSVGAVMCYGSDGECKWEKPFVDLDKVRSDTGGICFQLQGDGDGAFNLAIGASPASLEHGNNVFGSSDIRHCAELLVRTAARVMGCVLPSYTAWDIRRIDVTHNYLLDSPLDVHEALRCMLNADVSRRSRATSMGGSTVGFFKSSAFRAGKS